MKKIIPFHPLSTIEQRKHAINAAMEKSMPFRLQGVELSLPGQEPVEYTGGFTQMLLATAATLKYILI